MASELSTWVQAFPSVECARAVDVGIDALDDATWRVTARAEDLSPVVSYLVTGSQGAVLVDPGSAATWPATLRALASVRGGLDIRWVFGHSASPTSLGALPAIESTLGSEVIVVTTAQLAPIVSHYATQMPIRILAPGATLDIGGRRLVAESRQRPDGATVFLLRDTHTGMVFGSEALGGHGWRVSGQLESVRSAVEHVLQTTLVPIAIEGRALAALAPLGRVTSLRVYLKEGDTWFELGGRHGLRGREVPEPPPPTDTTVRVGLTDPAPIVLDFTVAEESAWVVQDPAIQGLAESLHPALVSSMRRILSLRDSAQAHRRLLADTRLDPLTGVDNRRTLQDWASGGRYAALLIDLDWFRHVHDELGHHSGDTLLRRVADVIGSQIRGQDLLIRYRGDEFLVLLDDVDSAVADVLADAIRASVSTLDATGLSPTGTVTVSIGVADGIGPVADVIARADSALHTAKAHGHDSVCVARGSEGGMITLKGAASQE